MRKKELIEQPLNYWEEKSYMMAIPKDQEEDLISSSFDRIASIENLKILETNYNVEGYIYAKIDYDDVEYEIGFYMGGVHVPDYYLNKSFLFKEKEREAILNAKKALTIFMEFKGDSKKCYHLELKLAHAMVPDMIGLMDESAERMFPAKWVALTAESKVLPGPKDLFTVQAVQSENHKVWLHTHGLARCNLTELEILESDEENYQNHFNLICTYAMYLIDKKGPFDPIGTGAYIGRLINGYPVVVTCLPWTEALSKYKKLELGGPNDRKDAHNTKTSVVFLYTSEENENNRVVEEVSIYDKLWGDNPLFFYSDAETKRMKALAMERFDYVKDASKDKDNAVLIKIGLPLEQEGHFEHIWFELLEIKGDKFKAKLTQEPYDIPDIHTGYEAWFTLKDVTDWIIYTPTMSVNPSNVYLLEK